MKYLQVVAKELASTINQDPAENTRSKSHNTLERAMYAACYIDDKNDDAQQLASQRYPAGIFMAAAVVMDIKLGDMTKYQQLTNYQDLDFYFNA